MHFMSIRSKWGAAWAAGLSVNAVAVACGRSPTTADGPIPNAVTESPTKADGREASTPEAVALSGARTNIARPGGTPLAARNFDVLRRKDIDALGFGEATEANYCFTPPSVAASDVVHDRALFVHDRATLDALGPKTFSLARTLEKISTDAIAAGASEATAESLFVALWDTQNPNAQAQTPAEGAHCDDDNTTLNGFPNACRPTEGAQAKAADVAAEIASYAPIGLVNRIDLAADGWKNCGEHRIVYGRDGGGFKRNLIIFEAVLPNPRPGCASGCREVAEHWQKLSTVSNPKDRARHLEKLFYQGVGSLRPVVHVAHYAAKPATSTGYGGAGSGQIRTNQFMANNPATEPWILKEFKLALDCSASPCVLDAVPIPVKVNPDGNLWTETTAGLGDDFQQHVVLTQVDALANADINAFSYQVPLVYDAARSQSLAPPVADHYANAYDVPGSPGGFKEKLATAATAKGLTDKQLVNRALALSCAGCHQPAEFGLNAADSIGPRMTWPDSTGSFVHVDVRANNGVHALSAALTDVFLPARAANLAKVLSAPACMCRFKRSDLPAPKLAELERLTSPKPPEDVGELRAREARLKTRIDAARGGAGSLPELAPEDARLDLKAVRDAAPAVRGVVRRKAVQGIVRDEPPRKTVTGHFRTH